jgi:MtaA/CmuA family methyltransferase
VTSKERIERVCAGESVDRPPVIPLFMRYAAQLVHTPFSLYCRDYTALVHADLHTHALLQYDMVSVISDAFREAHDLGARVEFPYDGVPYCRETLLNDYTDIVKVSAVDPRNTERMSDRIQAVRLFREKLGPDVPVLGWIEGAFAQACDLRGVDKTFMDTVDNPDFVFELVERTAAFELRFAEEQVRAGADWIGIGESVGSLVSVDTYQTFALPALKMLTDTIHEFGARVRLHICGDITHLLPVLADVLIDIIDLDWMVDIKTARQHLHSATVIAGNFDPVSVLAEGTPEDIRTSIQAGQAAAGERYCIAPGCEVPPDTPLENLLAFCPGRDGESTL